MMKLRIVTLKSAVCILGCTLLLSACAPLLLGGMAGTVVVATDRRTSGIQLEDEEIELRAASRIREMFGDRVHVNVNSFNLQVLLTGEVPTDRDRQAVYKIVWWVCVIFSNPFLPTDLTMYSCPVRSRRASLMLKI